jgi:hypothetical protein
MDSKSIYIDMEYWPKLKHNTSLEFHNAGQDLISTVKITLQLICQNPQLLQI